jgi:hypothetical protein
MFDVYMPYAFIFHMPVKLGLKLMASVSSYRMDAEGKLVNHIINKLNGILLIVTRIDFQCPDSSSVINGSILETPDSVAVKIPQRDKLHINLDVMAWNLFGITPSVNGPAGRTLWQYHNNQASNSI